MSEKEKRLEESFANTMPKLMRYWFIESLKQVSKLSSLKRC